MRCVKTTPTFDWPLPLKLYIDEEVLHTYFIIGMYHRIGTPIKNRVLVVFHTKFTCIALLLVLSYISSTNLTTNNNLNASLTLVTCREIFIESIHHITSSFYSSAIESKYSLKYVVMEV